MLETTERVTPDMIVAAARACVGAPFVHQGSDPLLGMDCRGLIEWVCYVLYARPIPPRNYQRRPSGAEFYEAMRAELVEIPLDEMRHGDAVMIRLPKDDEARHGGIICDGRWERMLVHAWDNARGEGRVIEEPLRGWKQRNITAAFRFPVTD